MGKIYYSKLGHWVQLTDLIQDGNGRINLATISMTRTIDQINGDYFRSHHLSAADDFKTVLLVKFMIFVEGNTRP